MTYIDPEQPAEIQPPSPQPPSPQPPEIDPGATPDDLPPLEPGGGEGGDSRPFDRLDARGRAD